MYKQEMALYRFDDFELDPARRQLCRAGVALPVPQKAFQLLLFLLDNPGRVLTKRELMDAVWPQSFVEENSLTQSIFLLRKALGEQSGQKRYIVTVPGEGYQFAVHPVTVKQAASPAIEPPATSAGLAPPPQEIRNPSAVPSFDSGPTESVVHKAANVSPSGLKRHWVTAAIALAMLLNAAGAAIWFVRSRPKLTVEGNVVLADFANTTGDPAFDTALRQGLAAQLEQSPNLGLISDARIAQTMKLMTQPKDTRLTPDLARHVCERTGSAAMIEGSITSLGHQYVLGVKALNCKSGDTLARDQETADNKEQVLRALGIAAGKLRRKLGESLPSLERHDAPPEEVTTGSLEALQAYSQGMLAQGRGDCPAAIAFYKQAISHDPDFAMAYSRIGVCDSSEEGVNSTRKAYLLRDRVSDREKFYLASHYEQYATGNLSAARRILEAWAATYPHDGDPGPNLLKLYLTTGEYEQALPLVQSIVRNSPGTPGGNASRRATTLLFLNRVAEAKAVLMDAVAHHNDGPVHHYYLYEIDFLQNDSAAMAREASFVRAQPGWDGNMLELESISASYFGKFALARSLKEQSVQAALRDQNAEDAAGVLAEGALEEALAGNKGIAEKNAKAGLALSKSSGVETLAGMALALAGDHEGAARTLEDMERRFPADTLAQVAGATMRACALLGNGNSPQGARRALDALAPAAPYALSGNLYLVPVYVLGQAYLAAGQSENAAAAFENILGHSGVTRNYITGSLARLGLADAEDRSGERRKARADYAEFIRLWQDADADQQRLREAKTSFHRLGVGSDLTGR